MQDIGDKIHTNRYLFDSYRVCIFNSS